MPSGLELSIAAWTALCKTRGTQARVAAACGITRGAVAKWPFIPTHHLHAVARELGIPREELRPELYMDVEPRQAGETNGRTRDRSRRA